ncbi:hypothetical protein BKA66DRAFT_436360 [Pyrenochaeta sp. MPI-SDFR-AT-0127]|nr:hypothetical protein BKA66DRAFT_436360 [Pyrenochaeta sp. MPI-SDFR-AT-0127]
MSAQTSESGLFPPLGTIHAKLAPPQDPATTNQEPSEDMSHYADYKLQFNLDDLPLLCRCKGVRERGECTSKKCYLVCYNAQCSLATTGVASKDFNFPYPFMCVKFVPNDPEILPNNAWLFLTEPDGCDNRVRELKAQIDGVNRSDESHATNELN